MLTRADALHLDATDPLAAFHAEFVHPEPDLIYLDGNSLGRLPRRARERLQHAIDHEWGTRLIRGWNEGWYTAPARVGGQIAQLIGAQADEVLACDSTSVNFFKLALAAVQARPGRTVIVTDEANFPSDIYVLQGVARLLGPAYSVRVLPPAEVLSALDDRVALLTLTHTAFKSGALYDLPAVTHAAHAAGALMLWDLSHSVGAVPVDLNGAHADLAVGCGYKYLNGGPGASAFLYVRRDLQDHLRNPIYGWFGQDHPFEFGLTYTPAPGLARFLTGTPNILSLAALEAALEVMLEAGLPRLRAKSIQQTALLIDLWQAWLEPHGVTLQTPRQPEQRGSHVSLGHPEAWRLNRALIEQMNVIPDFRQPDTLRLGVAPLYTRFVDVFDGMARLRHVLEARLYDRYPAEKPAVT